MEFAEFRRDDEVFERERKKYSSASCIMKNKVVIKEGKEGMRARTLRTQGEAYVTYKTANEEMIDNWNLSQAPEDAFHKVTEDETKEQMTASQSRLSIDLENLKKDKKTALTVRIINLVLTLLFIGACYGITAGILKLDEVVILNFDNIYIIYGGYFLFHAGIPVLVFRLLRIAESASMEHYIRIWHQIVYIGASLVASLLMFNYMAASTIGLVVLGVCQMAVILLTFFPNYQD